MSEIIAALSQAIVRLTNMVTRKAEVNRWSVACKQFAALLGEGTIVLDGHEVKANAFTEAVSYFDSLTGNESEVRAFIVEQTAFLRVALRNGMVPEDDVEAAELALGTWTEVQDKLASSPKARQLRAAS